MRILYCNKYNFRFSGTEAYLFDAMEQMRLRGHRVALFSMSDRRGEAAEYEQHFLPAVDFKGARGIFSKARLAGHAIYSAEARRRIGEMVEEFRPDVAHVRNIYHHLSPSILWELKSRGVPVVYHMSDFKLICPSYNLVSSNGSTCEKCKGGKFWNVMTEGCYAAGTLPSAVLAVEAYFHRWISTYEKCVDLILAPSKFAREKLIENGWKENRIAVLPHFQSCTADVAPHPGSSAPILYFGRLSAEKGIDDLLAAMQRLPGIRLVIAGDGPQRACLEAMAHNREMRNVLFVGHVTGPALEKLIAESQFTIFPSRAYETLGKSILESYAQARAVVASDLGSRRELVEDGETGLLYSVQNVDQLAAAISFLHARPAVAARMGEAGRELVLKRHSQEDHLGRLEQIYEGLLQHQPTIISFPRPIDAKPEPDLKVAFIGGRGVVSKYSGIETYYEEVGSRLAQMGHQVTAYCRAYFTPPMEEHNGLRIVRLPTVKTKHVETLVHTFLSTMHACVSDYDVVNYHTLGPSLFSFLPRLCGKKTVVTVQGLDWQRKKWGRVARAALRVAEWTSATFPNRTIVVSRQLLRHYRSRHNQECSYVPNGTKLRERLKGTALDGFGLEPGRYVLFAGRFSPEKNCHLLIEAFEKLQTTMKLILAGGSSHTDGYVRRIRHHESDRIKFLDWLSGIALEELLTNAALFVLPSDMEGMSLALLDAMGAGVCVLASDIPENLETIGGAGFTFKRGDVEDLRSMLEVLLSNENLRTNAGRLAQERIRQNYLWGTVAEEISSVYQSLMGRKRELATRATIRKAA